jgi:hypothetical protein
MREEDAVPRIKHHNVYVVELDGAVWEEPRFRKANPHCEAGCRCFYVGMTGLSPGERFENHLKGHKGNRLVREYGLRLCPLLYEEYNPLSYIDACEMEAELARILRGRGHAVWQR